MALLDAVLDVVRNEYAKTEPVWKPSHILLADMSFLEEESSQPSSFDPFGWRKEMLETYKKGKAIADVRECAYGRVVAIGKQLEGIPWDLWGRILRLYGQGKKAKVYFLANPYLRLFPKGTHPIRAGNLANAHHEIGPPHINGGYTYTCNKETIVIYRAEDATRVLIHELQHASCLDHVEHGTDLVEAETEAWAELLYAGLLSQGKKPLFHELVRKQSAWMIAQNEKVKQHMRTERQFPWRYTVAKQEVWERWGILSGNALRVTESLRATESLRLTPPPSAALQRVFGTHSTIL
jgi:hypothetical protein